MLVAVGAALVSVPVDRSILLVGLGLFWAGIKAVGWMHAGHFFKRYIPRKTRLGRWSPAMSGDQVIT
jgi:hypothetical protein